MPRDDLSIDLVKMPQVESQDAAAVLEDFTYRSQNLPAEIQFIQEEMADKDRRMQECLTIINLRDNAIQKWIRQMGSHTPNPKEEGMRRTISENYDKVLLLQEEKVALAQKTQQIVDKHLRYLDTQIKILQEKGDFPNDPDIPSLLRPQPASQNIAAITAHTSGGPLSQIHNSASINALTRLSGQHPTVQRIPPAAAQTTQISSSMAASAPATPAAAILLNRQARESSAGASNKRQRLNSTTGNIPTTSSGLARHQSAGPGTPKAGTPAAARAGSAGPRASQKVISTGNKKVAPHKQASARKAKPGKSGLSRVKRTGGNKGSPTSTNDSELSDAESGSGEEEDEVTTPNKPGSGRGRGGGDGDGAEDGDDDDDMGEGDDDDGGDDRKYCTCESVSYGDMVACDNDNCPIEWFHWSCVGLKSEPVGQWICPVCIKNAKKG